MKRQNFTLKQETIDLLEKLSDAYFEGNKSRTVIRRRIAIYVERAFQKDVFSTDLFSKREVDQKQFHRSQKNCGLIVPIA